MGTPFLGEIKIMSFNFAPKGWAQCNGQLLPINQNQALFSLLGTMYGGNGQTTFALPNLQGQVPMHFGQGFIQGQVTGEYNHTLITSELPAHSHSMNVSTTGPFIGSTGRFPGGNTIAQGAAAPVPATPINIWGTGSPSLAFTPSAISNTGGSQPHANQQPYLTLNFCIALQGVFPSRN
jgi:microcystin-dependent protein